MPVTEPLQRRDSAGGARSEAEIGARIRIAPGAHVLVSDTRAGYGDALLFPVSMTFPEFDNRIEKGVTVLYNTRDLRLSTFRAGLSYQF